MINEDLIKTAKLARINIQDNQETMIKELASILDYVEVVNTVEGDLTKQPNISGNINIFKNDEIEDSLSIDQILKNTPKSSGNYIEIEGIF